MAAEGLRKAQSAAAQLDAGAQQVQSRAGGTGFRGVAELVGQVRQRLNRIRQEQAALAATVTPISDTVRRVTDGTNPAEAVATLAPAAQQIGTASTNTSAMLPEIDRLKTDIEAATKGGQPGPLIAMANGIKHAVAHAAGSLDTAKRRTDQTISEARQLGTPSAGDGGGAGATPPSPDPSPGDPGADIVRFSSGGKGAWNRVLNRRLLPNARYVDEATGYTYDTDAEGRVTAIRGTLIAEAGDRNSYQQRVAGGTDRLATDDGGHFIATVFKGPGERINLAPMDVNLNRGAWKAMENRWTEALEEGKQVEVTIDVTYTEGSRRPIYYVVKYTISGAMPVRRRFKNSPGGK